MHRVQFCVLAGFFLAGCHGGANPPRPAPEFSLGDGAIHLLIYEWRGHSYGADFMRTSLWACEVDFGRQHMRTLLLAARHPEPMIDAPGESPPPPLLDEPWRPIDGVEAYHLRRAVADWLATSPPGVCDFYAPPGGREDGYMMRFQLRTDDATYDVRANPPLSRSEMDPCVPGAAFWTIVGALKPRLLPH